MSDVETLKKNIPPCILYGGIGLRDYYLLSVNDKDKKYKGELHIKYAYNVYRTLIADGNADTFCELYECWRARAGIGASYFYSPMSAIALREKVASLEKAYEKRSSAASSTLSKKSCVRFLNQYRLSTSLCSLCPLSNHYLNDNLEFELAIVGYAMLHRDLRFLNVASISMMASYEHSYFENVGSHLPGSHYMASSDSTIYGAYNFIGLLSFCLLKHSAELENESSKFCIEYSSALSRGERVFAEFIIEKTCAIQDDLLPGSSAGAKCRLSENYSSNLGYDDMCINFASIVCAALKAGSVIDESIYLEYINIIEPLYSYNDYDMDCVLRAPSYIQRLTNTATKVGGKLSPMTPTAQEFYENPIPVLKDTSKTTVFDVQSFFDSLERDVFGESEATIATDMTHIEAAGEDNMDDIIDEIGPVREVSCASSDDTNSINYVDPIGTEDAAIVSSIDNVDGSDTVSDNLVVADSMHDDNFDVLDETLSTDADSVDISITSDEFPNTTEPPIIMNNEDDGNTEIEINMDMDENDDKDGEILMEHMDDTVVVIKDESNSVNTLKPAANFSLSDLLTSFAVATPSPSTTESADEQPAEQTSDINSLEVDALMDYGAESSFADAIEDYKNEFVPDVPEDIYSDELLDYVDIPIDFYEDAREDVDVSISSTEPFEVAAPSLSVKSIKVSDVFSYNIDSFGFEGEVSTFFGLDEAKGPTVVATCLKEISAPGRIAVECCRYNELDMYGLLIYLESNKKYWFVSEGCYGFFDVLWHLFMDNRDKICINQSLVNGILYRNDVRARNVSSLCELYYSIHEDDLVITLADLFGDGFKLEVGKNIYEQIMPLYFDAYDELNSLYSSEMDTYVDSKNRASILDSIMGYSFNLDNVGNIGVPGIKSDDYNEFKFAYTGIDCLREHSGYSILTLTCEPQLFVHGFTSEEFFLQLSISVANLSLYVRFGLRLLEFGGSSIVFACPVDKSTKMQDVIVDTAIKIYKSYNANIVPKFQISSIDFPAPTEDVL